MSFDVRRLQVESLSAQRALLQSAGTDVAALASAQLLDESSLTRLHAEAIRRGIPLNTDGNRYLEFMTPRYNLVDDDLLMKNLKFFYDFVDTPERKAAIVAVRKRIYGK